MKKKTTKNTRAKYKGETEKGNGANLKNTSRTIHDTYDNMKKTTTKKRRKTFGGFGTNAKKYYKTYRKNKEPHG